jgi:hypothetical protein
MPLISTCTSSSKRWFPSSVPHPESYLELEGALNEQFSFQIVMRLDDEERQTVKVTASVRPSWDVRVRRVGYVPVRHHNTPIEPVGPDLDCHGEIPGFVPDPLFEESELLLPEGEAHAFWITVSPGEDAEPGTYHISVEVDLEGGISQTHRVPVTLHNVRLEARESFSITHWFYNDALMDYYRTDGYDEAFWEILPAYLRNAAEHGLDTLYVPVFTPPLDGVKRPSQLLHITRSGHDKYQFDWQDVNRYVETARKCGISKFEWCHLFTQWGARSAIRIYDGQGQDESLLWDADTSATSDTYRIFLSQFLPEFKQFLADNNLMDRSFFHISDEPHGEEHLASYREARNMLQDLAPWMPTMDALTEIAFASEGLTDMPIPSITTALDFNAADIPSWCYYCCGPRGRFLNRLLDTPLSKIAMHGLLFYRWPFQGFLHWGFNYWYKSQTRHLIDPFSVQDGLAWDRAWAYGDPFVVYPGPDGPIDSIRWEIFAESLQDYRLLQTLGISREHDALMDLVSFEDFPKDESWRSAFRKRIFSEAT